MERWFNELLERHGLKRSATFKPWPWYTDLPDEVFTEDQLVYVYRQTDINEWSVGFFTPSGDWEVESTWDSKEKAAARVRWLLGGN